MNSVYLLKWFVPVEVQDEERSTSPALLRSSSPTLKIQVEHYYYFSSLKCMRMEWECLERGEWRPFYRLRRSVPAIFWYGNVDNRLCEDKGGSPAKTHLDWCQSRFGWPHLVGFGHRLWPGDWHVGPLLCTSVPGLCMSVCSINWALFVSVTHDWIFCAFVSRLLCVFVLFRVWVPAIQDSPKLMEMVSNRPYNYIWCSNVMKRCRSWRLYFWLKDHQQHPHT